MSPTQEQARQKIRQLVNKYRAMSDADRRLISESAVVHQFLDPFLEALGWPVHDPARYKYELSTLAGRPDMILTPEQGGTIFVEAKRFGKIEELAQARQTLRAELDALAAHLYGLSREEFAHILGTFPLVFPPTAEGQAKKAALLAVFDRFAAEVAGWPRR